MYTIGKFDIMLKINIHGVCYLQRSGKCSRVFKSITASITVGLVLRENEHVYMIVDRQTDPNMLAGIIDKNPSIYIQYLGTRTEYKFIENNTYNVSFDENLLIQNLDTGITKTLYANTIITLNLCDASEYKNKIIALKKISNCPVSYLRFDQKLSLMKHYKKAHVLERRENIEKWARGNIDPEYIAMSISLWSDFTLASCLNISNAQQNILKIMDLMKIKIKSLDCELAECMLVSATNTVENSRNSNDHLLNRFAEVNGIRNFVSKQYDRLENFVSVNLICD